MPSQLDLSIITVAFNSENEINKWVESLVSTIKKNSFEMIVSDNSEGRETEKEVLKLQGKYKNLHYIHNDKNVGFSEGNNIGVKKSKGEYVLFLNPDVIVEENTIDGMIEFMKEHADCGAASPAVFLPNGKLDDSCHRGFPTPWNSFSYFSGLAKMFPKTKLFAGYNMTYLNFQETHEVDSIAGSFLLISRELGEKLKWWDNDYFFYGEDIDFCFRIKKAGFSIYFVPGFKATHFKGLSSGIKKVSKNVSRASLETRIWATNQRFNAMEIFYKKHYVRKYPWIVNKMVLAGISFKRSSAMSQLNK